MVAFRNGFPASPGQPPIVPRRHVTRLTDLEPDELTDLWLLGTSLCRDLERSLGASAFNLGMNVGRAAGQTVDHLYLHVIPRYQGDVADPRGGVRWVLPGRARCWGDK